MRDQPSSGTDHSPRRRIPSQPRRGCAGQRLLDLDDRAGQADDVGGVADDLQRGRAVEHDLVPGAIDDGHEARRGGRRRAAARCRVVAGPAFGDAVPLPLGQRVELEPAAELDVDEQAGAGSDVVDRSSDARPEGRRPARPRGGAAAVRPGPSATTRPNVSSPVGTMLSKAISSSIDAVEPDLQNAVVVPVGDEEPAAVALQGILHAGGDEVVGRRRVLDRPGTDVGDHGEAARRRPRR